MIKVTDFLSLPDEELRFTASLSGGPGGQNVNKLNTRITLWFDVIDSPSLSQAQKELILRRLGSRINRDGVLRVVSQQTRSQLANREDAIARFVDLLAAALRQAKPRKKTRISNSAKTRRLEEKRRHGFLKRRRSDKISCPPRGDDFE